MFSNGLKFNRRSVEVGEKSSDRGGESTAVEIAVLSFISEISVKCTLRYYPAGVSGLCLGTLFLVFLLISVSLMLCKVFQAPAAWVSPRTWLEMWIIRTQFSPTRSESAFQKDPRGFLPLTST